MAYSGIIIKREKNLYSIHRYNWFILWKINFQRLNICRYNNKIETHENFMDYENCLELYLK